MTLDFWWWYDKLILLVMDGSSVGPIPNYDKAGREPRK